MTVLSFTSFSAEMYSVLSLPTFMILSAYPFISSHFSISLICSGSKNISASICENSTSLISVCLGDISFLYTFPACAIPFGSLILIVLAILDQFVNIVWQVSGRK